MKIFKLLLLLLGCFLILTTCQKFLEDLDSKKECENPVYPIEIPITEVNVPDECIWKEYTTHYSTSDKFKINLINTEVMLYSFTSCADIFPKIDFRTQSVLLVSGTCNQGIEKTDKKLIQLSNSTYRLSTNILLNDEMVVSNWRFAIIVPKIDSETSISMEIEEKTVDAVDLQMDGYIIGFDRCSGVKIDDGKGKAGGYYIVSTNLKDTVLTYNLPENIFDFPAGCFPATFSSPVWFSDTYNKEFKVNIQYKIAFKEEIVYPLCQGNILIQNVNATQIIVKSARKN